MVSDNAKLSELTEGEEVVDEEVTEVDEICGRAPPGVTASLVRGATRISLRRDGHATATASQLSRN